METQVSEILKVARVLIGKITLEKLSDEIVVGGPFKEIKDIFPSLKRKGFRFHRPTKTWRVDVSDISDRQLKNVENLVEDLNGASESKLDDDKIISKDFQDAVSHLKSFGILKSGSGFYLTGDVFEFKSLIHKAGGKWEQRGYYFQYGTMDIDALDEILTKLKTEQKEINESSREGLAVANELNGKDWGFVRCLLIRDELRIFSSDYKYRDMIKGSFPTAKWNSSSKEWVVLVQNLTKSSAKNFIGRADEFAKKDESSGGVDQPSGGGGVDKPSGGEYVIRIGEGYAYHQDIPRKGDVFVSPKKGPEFLYVLKRKDKYYSEDGMSLGVGDESGYVYTLYCREATEEEAAPLKRDISDRGSKRDALNRIEEIRRKITQIGKMPEKWINPKGKRYSISSQTLYGGGSWFILNASGRIWYVQNNGADGDDWGRNNVETGGAGAIGWFIDDKEILEELERLFVPAKMRSE